MVDLLFLLQLSFVVSVFKMPHNGQGFVQAGIPPEPKYSNANSRSLNVQPYLHKIPC